MSVPLDATIHPYPSSGAEIVRPINDLNAAFEIFKFLPHDDDPRWDFLSRYGEVSNQVGFTAINFTNAYYYATYLSATPSYAVGYVRTVGDKNELQLSRALDNVSHRFDIRDRFGATQPDTPGLVIRLAETDRLTTDPTKTAREVTPCPEALYQLRLYTEGRYLARVGFNIHHEGEAVVQSLVNIQGIPNGLTRIRQFEAEFGTSPFNVLVRRAVAMGQACETVYEPRGLLNPKEGDPHLYWLALEAEGVPHWEAMHKPLQGPPQETPTDA